MIVSPGPPGSMSTVAGGGIVAGPQHRSDAERDVTLLFQNDKSPALVGDGLEVEEPGRWRGSRESAELATQRTSS